MQVKYDSFNRFEVPKLTLCLPGSTYVDGRVNGAIGILSHTSDEEIVANFNEVSSLNFVVYKVDSGHDPDDNYGSIKNKMTIFVDGIGFFIITSVEETISADVTYKNVSAESCEREIENKMIPAAFYAQDSEIENTYNATYDFTTLLEMLVANLPLWVIDHVDATLATKHRTFEDVSEDTNILSFFLNDMQDAYECIFTFDTINRVINVYDQNNYVAETSIHLTNDDIVNSIQIDKSSDDIYTAINVMGDNDITISGINPLGSNVIYNFDYYLDTMPSTLSSKVSIWQAMVDGYLSDYYDLNAEYYDALGNQRGDTYEIDRINGLIEIYNRCKDNIVAASNLTDSNEICHTTSGEASDRIVTVASEFNASGTDIVVRKTYSEELTITSNKATMTYTPSNTSIRVFVKDSSGIYIKELTQAVSVATDKFVYNASDHSLSFYSGQFPNNTKIGVFYNTDAPGVENDVVIVTSLLAEIENAIDELVDERAQAQEALDDATVEISTLRAQIEAIHSMVDMETYFTQSELELLSLYIFEGSYRDSYVVITDSMTYPEQLAQMKILYDRAKQQLERISTPTEQFTVDVENFIFQKRFEHWASELETGKLINVELYPGDIAQLFLSNFTVNYEDHTLSMTFGNRFKKFDTKSLFSEMLGGISRTANSLNFVKEIIYPIRQGEFDLIKQALSNIRMLSAGQALTSQNQDFIIDSTGITGRQSDSDGDYYPEQLKIVNNMIALTDDNWETCKVAIGKLLLGDGTYRYGVNAEVLIGDLIIGNELHILGKDEHGNTYDLISAMDGRISLMATKTELASVRQTAENAETNASSAASSASSAASSASSSASAAAAAQSAAEDVQTRANNGEFNGTTVIDTEVSYQSGTSGTVAPTGNWSSSIPSTAQGEYLWTKTVVTYSDGNSSTSYSVSRNAVNGSSGTSPTVTNTTVEYQQSTGGSSPPTGTWSTTVPTAVDGQFIWTRTTVTYSDGATSVSYAVSRNGSSATSYSLIVSNAAVVKGVDGSFNPASITLTAKAQTGTAAMANYNGRFKIETTTNNSTWTSQYTSSTNENSKTYTVPSGVIAIRCSLYLAGGTTTLLDQQVVPIVSDGVDGEPAYTIVLTNESHTFAGGTTAAVAGSAECQVIAYKGATQVAATIGSISGMPTGMSVSLSNNGTTSAKFTVSVTTSMTTANGVLTVPVTVDGKSFEKKFTYSLSLNGANGTSPTAYNLIVSHAAISKSVSGTYNPSSITLEAKSQTGNGAMENYGGRFKIETTTNNSSWTAQYTSSSNESSKSYTVPSGIIAIRCSLYMAGGTTTLLDQQTIPIVFDGADGDPAYTLILSNESHTFAGGTTAAIAGSTECQVIAYKGATQVAATIGTISGAPTGMSTSISNNGTTTAKFTVSVTTSMTSKNGVLTIPVTVDGKNFEKKFTYSLSLNGTNGTNGTSPTAYSLIVSHAAVGKSKNGSYNPASITLTAKSQTGNASIANYSGRFVIETTANNTTWTSRYSSTSDESTKSYTIPNDVIAIRCSLYLAGGTSTLLDQHTIPVVVDGVDGQGSQWYYGTALTHTSGTGTATVSGATVGSMYLNTQTADIYKCTAVSGTTSTWTYAGNIADGVLSNIDVGGRNLLLQSATKHISPYAGATITFTDAVTVAEWGISGAIRAQGSVGSNNLFATLSGVSVDMTSISGQHYVHSIYIKNNGTANLSIGNNLGNSFVVEPNTTKRAVIQSVGNGANYLQFVFTSAGGANFDFCYYHPQIEFGNLVTDWSPAPEDLYTTITSNFDVLDDRISSKVSSETYYLGLEEAKGYADEKADSAKNDAMGALNDYKQTVSTTYTTLTQTENKITTAVQEAKTTLQGQINTVSSGIEQTARNVAINVMNGDSRLTYLSVEPDGFYIGSDNASIKIRQTAGSASEPGAIQFVETGSGLVLGEFTTNGLITSQVETDDQVVFRSGSVGKWAIRKGATVNGKVNLNDVWIGG